MLPAHHLTHDQIQNFLGKGDNNAASQSQKAVAPLRRIMRLQGEAHLNNAPTQQDKAHGTDQAKDKGAQVVDHRQRVACA